ncbi:DUF7008 domain-containing protein [Nocardia sp. NPDC051750]|uniref:DUF7008 domain-containing protein n=1 Tax=Nocardia sp. NPDC051750 TaxID=3364325 RepID=UPI0037AE6C58
MDTGIEPDGNRPRRHPAGIRIRPQVAPPQERFISYATTRDLYGWAGWDHREQAFALATHLTNTAPPTEEITPLLAALLELQPWLDQWHTEVDPAYGLSPPPSSPPTAAPSKVNTASLTTIYEPGAHRPPRAAAAAGVERSIPPPRAEHALRTAKGSYSAMQYEPFPRFGI